VYMASPTLFSPESLEIKNARICVYTILRLHQVVNTENKEASQT
jgi:hypothetical protein